jgi:hypothetical protein
MVLYIHHVHFIVFFAMFLFHEGILCTEYSAGDMSQSQRKYFACGMTRKTAGEQQTTWRKSKS